MLKKKIQLGLVLRGDQVKGLYNNNIKPLRIDENMVLITDKSKIKLLYKAREKPHILGFKHWSFTPFYRQNGYYKITIYKQEKAYFYKNLDKIRTIQKRREIKDEAL